MAVGLVGGATKLHPTARLALQILDVKTAEELARIVAAVGLAQNFSAIKALATTGYTDVKEFQRVEVVVAPHSHA